MCPPGPCAPERVGVDLRCENNTAMLHWEDREGVELYEATVTCTLSGQSATCNCTDSMCQFPGLYCGGTYQFNVIAHGSTCSSQASSTVELMTGIGYTACDCMNIQRPFCWCHPLPNSSFDWLVQFTI